MTYMTRLLLSVFLLGLLAFPAFGVEKKVAALVDGKPIYAQELSNAKLSKLRGEVFEMERNLVLGESLKRLRKNHPKEFGGKNVQVSEEEIKSFYNQAKLESKGSLEMLREQIRAYLMRGKQSRVDSRLLALAEKKGYLKIMLKEPARFLYTLPVVKRNASMGNPNAPVQIIEFSDFQCQFCQKVVPTLKKLVGIMKSQVHIQYRHLPLAGIHPEAVGGAEASECAADQNKFWPYHDALFAKPNPMNRRALMKAANTAGIPDKGKFQQCLISGKYRKRVQGDIAQAGSLGITGTPGFLIGHKISNGMIVGEVMTGARPIDQFFPFIERATQRASKGKKRGKQ